MQKRLLQINIITYISVIVINILAIKIPFFGKTPREVAELHQSLLTPDYSAFKMWPIVYALLGLFAFVQAKLLFNKTKVSASEVSSIGLLFLISSVLNFLWILAWQSQNLYLSFGIIFILWLVLILIYYRLAIIDKPKWFYWVPFSVYLAWVCVAALLNLNFVLIDLGFNFFGLSEEYWIAIIITTTIGGTLFMLLKNKDLVFALVVIWSFYWIYYKHDYLFDEANLTIYLSLSGIILLSFVGTVIGLHCWKQRRMKLR